MWTWYAPIFRMRTSYAYIFRGEIFEFWRVESSPLPPQLPGRGGVYSTQLFSPMNSSKISPKYMGCGECSPKSMYNNVHLKRKRGGGWCFFTQIEPNWPLPYSTVPVQCREPKTGQEKVQFYCEDDWLWPSCYYLSMTTGNGHCR